MFIVALTGGIGSGKTTIADRLAELGAGVVDTDQLSRELTADGGPMLPAIREAFGGTVFQPDGRLDRSALRRLVFDDPQSRARLESILHPPIRQRMLERIDRLDTPYAVIVVPLLFETGQQSLADRVLVVDVPESVQIERVRKRNGLTVPEIERIVASQTPREERLARADDIIDNSGPPENLESQIQRIHRRYLDLCQASPHETNTSR
ncbi:dephospho-CoA kinase [Imhoffiella purpurea]|uniref:Dephospho-CoA kinase n=1 Tax=Imhoffiella purpurea TaxID=1249627 RepID=W9V6I8_9GAMM|nr:dephospho-CoA kinase [Imhoffiella purpurea]EXJ14994.1 Dephospho-CoA kinase [Imhoffiella purpurea]